jgi:hypothetical protein
MGLNNKLLVELTEADIVELVTNKVAEGRIIDYKVELHGNSASDKREFLYDVSSFANTDGGHIIYGIHEEGGIPLAIVGVKVEDPDKLTLALLSSIRDGIEPRINGVDIAIIPVINGSVVVIRILRSWAAPHMVIFDKAYRIYARDNAAKYQPNVLQLRTAFLASDAAAEMARKFRLDRINSILSGKTPISLHKSPMFVLHLIPFDTFNSGVNYDISGLLNLQNNSPMQKIISHSDIGMYKSRFNFDGALAFQQNLRYLQVFRNGIIEYLESESPGTSEYNKHYLE